MSCGVGRHGNQARGEAHGLAKLDAKQVRAIRASRTTATTLASRGISVGNVFCVKHRLTWRHVP